MNPQAPSPEIEQTFAFAVDCIQRAEVETGVAALRWILSCQPEHQPAKSWLVQCQMLSTPTSSDRQAVAA